MQERLHRRVGAEIAPDASEPHEPEIHGEVRIAEQAAADLAELRRRSHEPADDPDETQHHEKRGQDALGAPGVKHREREPSGGALGQNDSRNEKAGDDKEDVDADEASGKPGAIGVEDDHAEHRERAQSVDVGSEIERLRSARRDQVRRFEGFVQHAGSVGGRQSPTVRRDGVNRLGAIGKPRLGSLARSASRDHIAAHAIKRGKMTAEGGERPTRRPVPRTQGRECERGAAAAAGLFRRLPAGDRDPDQTRPAAAIAL